MAQLVARYLGVVEAASSSLVTQTSIKTDDFCHPFFAFLGGEFLVTCVESARIHQGLRSKTLQVSSLVTGLIFPLFFYVHMRRQCFRPGARALASLNNELS